MLPLVPGNGLKNLQRDVVIRRVINPASSAWQRTQKLTKTCSYKTSYKSCLFCLAMDSKMDDEM